MNGCPVCGASRSVFWRSIRGFDLARCQTCGLLYVNPMPSQEALEGVYQDPGYFNGCEDQGYADYAAMEKALRPHFERRAAEATRLAPQRGRLLDFGCATGYFLETAQGAGWDVAGIELSRSMADETRLRLGVGVYNSLQELPASRFDAITLWEVIEHLPLPVETLNQLSEHLVNGGLLMLSTPNNGHWQALSEPESWPAYRPPAHLLYFDETTLADALKRAGFERISVSKLAPLPPLPEWLRRLSAPLQTSLSTGRARLWPVALAAWRAIRLVGWGWQRVAHRPADVFATLEAVAFKPK